MDTNTFLSRIARQWSLRRAEAVALASTVVAFGLTIVLVEGVVAVESNPATAWLIEEIGWTGAGIVAIAFEGAIIALYYRLESHFPRVSHGAAASLVLVGVGDVLLNVRLLAVAGLPETMALASYAPAVVATAGAALVVYVRPDPSRLRDVARVATSSGGRLTLAVVVVAAMVVLSVMLAPVGFGPVKRAEAAVSGPVFDDFEDGDIAEWSGGTSDLTTTTNSIEGSYSGLVQPGDSVGNIDLALSSSTYTNISVYANWSSFGTDSTLFGTSGNGGDGPQIRFDSDGSVVARYSGGTTDTGFNLSPDMTYKIVMANLDYSNNNYEIHIYKDGSLVHASGPYSFYGTPSDTGQFWMNPYSSGSGSFRIDYVATGESLAQPVSGYTKDTSGNTIAASISTNTSKSTTSGADGAWSIELGDGTYDITASKTGRVDETQTVTVSGSAVSGVNFTLAPTLNGTVTDKSGNPVANATVEATQSGTVIKSTTTDANGNYQLPVAGGESYNITAKKDQYLSKTTQKTVSGTSTTTVGLTLQPNEISGRAVTQTGDPVENATVTVRASLKPTIPDSEQQLQNLTNPIPPQYSKQMDNNFHLLGSSGALASTDSPVPLIYEPSDLGLGWGQDPDVTEPMVLNVPANQRVAITLASRDGDCGLFGAETQTYNRQILGPTEGCLLKSGSATVERLTPTGEVAQDGRTTVPLKPDSEQDLIGKTEINHGIHIFQNGFYRISYSGPEGNYSYLIKAGTPLEDFEPSQNTINGTLSDRSQAYQNAINQNTLMVKRTPTNATGHFSVSLPSNAMLATVSAYKAPACPDIGNQSQQDISNCYSGQDPPLASVYLPSTPKTVDSPASGVTLTMVEMGFPSSMNISTLQTENQRLRERLANQSGKQVVKQVVEQNASLSELRTAYREMAGLIRSNPALREAYLRYSPRTSVASASDLSKSELRAETQYMTQAVQTTGSTGSVERQSQELTNETISQVFRVRGVNLAESNVSVIAHYSNGTAMPVPQQYITVDDTLERGGVVRVSDYPLGQADPASVYFEVVAAGQQGVAQGTSDPVTNPTFSGTVPKLASIDVSTLTPGPNDKVRMTLDGASSSEFRNVTGSTVYGPSGNTIPSSVKNGKTVTFETNGQGVYTAKVKFADFNGSTFVETVRLNAGKTDLPRPPGIRAVESPYGTYALTGDGLSGGNVQVTPNGGLTLTAAVPEGAEVPHRVHAYTVGIDQGAKATSPFTDTTVSTTNIQLVREGSEQAITKHVTVLWHSKDLNDDAYVIRRAGGDDEPITMKGTSAGDRDENQTTGQTLVESYTTSSGRLTVVVVNNPWIDKQIWWLAETSGPVDPDSVPFLSTASPATTQSMAAAGRPPSPVMEANTA